MTQVLFSLQSRRLSRLRDHGYPSPSPTEPNLHVSSWGWLSWGLVVLCLLCSWNLVAPSTTVFHSIDEKFLIVFLVLVKGVFASPVSLVFIFWIQLSCTKILSIILDVYSLCYVDSFKIIFCVLIWLYM